MYKVETNEYSVKYEVTFGVLRLKREYDKLERQKKNSILSNNILIFDDEIFEEKTTISS